MRISDLRFLKCAIIKLEPTLWADVDGWFFGFMNSLTDSWSDKIFDGALLKLLFKDTLSEKVLGKES